MKGEQKEGHGLRSNMNARIECMEGWQIWIPLLDIKIVLREVAAFLE